MKLLNRFVSSELVASNNAIVLESRTGLLLTIMEYSNKGVIVVTCDLHGKELSRILISSEHGHQGEIFSATTMETFRG